MLKTTQPKNQHRGRLDVIIDILQVAKKGAKKTKIVYGANLNFEMLERYVKDLTRMGLIKQEGNEWRTTEKGKNAVQYFRAGFRRFGL